MNNIIFFFFYIFTFVDEVEVIFMEFSNDICKVKLIKQNKNNFYALINSIPLFM